MPAVFEEEWHMSVLAKETFLRSFGRIHDVTRGARSSQDDW